MKRLTIAMAILFLASELFSAQSMAAEKFRIGTGIRGSPNYFLSLMAVEERGFWKEQGLEGQWIPFSSSVAMGQALLANAIEMGIHSIGGLLLQTSRGIPAIGVANLAKNEIHYIWVRIDSPIKTPQDLRDLRGAKIGVARVGDTVWAYGLALAKALGLNYRLVALGGVPSMVAGLRAGVVDGVVLTPMTMAGLEFQGLARRVIGVGEHTPRALDDVIVWARKELVQKDRELAKRGLKAVFRGGRFSNDNPSWAVEKIKAEMKWPEALAKKVYEEMPRYSRDGAIDPKGYERLRTFMLEYEIISKKAPPMEELYTTQLVPVE